MADRLTPWLWIFLSGAVVASALALSWPLLLSPLVERAKDLTGLSTPKLLIIDLSFDPGSDFAVAPLTEKLVKALSDDHGAAFRGIGGGTAKVAPLQATADEALPANLAEVEAELLNDTRVQNAEMTIFGWRRGDQTWLAFLPRHVEMQNGLQHYNPQGRVIGLPKDLENDDRGSLIAAFALAQAALVRKDKSSRDDIEHLVATRARLKTVLQNLKFANDPELWRAFGTISMAVDELERRFDSSFSDAVYLQETWDAYERALGVCDVTSRCAHDRVAQIYDDLGNVHVALGDLEGPKTRAGEKSRYFNAIEAYQKARSLWNHGQSVDGAAGALAANNLGVARLKLGRLVRDERSAQASLQDFQSALTVWQHLEDRARHHCAWAMTQKNRAEVCPAQSSCKAEALAAAETAAKAGKCL